MPFALRSTMPKNYAEILSDCTFLTIVDLVLKIFVLFVGFWYPNPPMLKELFIVLVSSAVTSAIALYGLFIEKEPINKSKWFLPELIHRALIYLPFFFIVFLYFVVIDQSNYDYVTVIGVLFFLGSFFFIGLFAFVQMCRMFSFKWTDLIMVTVVEEEKSKSNQKMMA